MNNLHQIRKKLENRELCLGTHVSTADLDYYEMCGHMGYDYIWVDNEHAGMTWPMIKNAIIATNGGGASAFVRAQDHETAHIKPIIENGPDGVIFPMVNTAEEARKLVSICSYPPTGTRGFGPIRGIDYGLKDFDQYVAEADSSILKLMQCEHVEAVNNLDEILAVPGVDVIICGPMDLSASIGKLGQWFDPEMVKLMETIIEKCHKAGKPFGLSVGMGEDLVNWWIERGASFVSTGTPWDYFREMSVDMIRKLREKEAQTRR